MEKNFHDFDPQEVMKLANSDIGKQLMQLFQANHSAQTKAVMDNVKAGNMEQAKQAIAAFMADPQTQALIKKMQEDSHGRNGR